MKKFAPILYLLLAVACTQKNKATTTIASALPDEGVAPHVEELTLVVLGIMQDGGAPHIGCKKDCCKQLFLHPELAQKVVSLGIADPVANKSYLFDATPDMPTQIKALNSLLPGPHGDSPDAIFLTHAHIGHYTGLMYLGKEAMFTNKVPVFAMPRMKSFLELNGPWSQLIHYKNIMLQPLSDGKPVRMAKNLTVTPFLVPHRDEYAETVGYRIHGPNKKLLFIPDIDKWKKWDSSIIKAIAGVDYAFIDGTFYNAAEIDNRDISQIPHPFIAESMLLFDSLPLVERQKIWFIHFNHSNPLIKKKYADLDSLTKKGYHIAETDLRFQL